MKYVSIGKYVISSWVLGVVLACICLSAFALYMALTFTIPFEVKEPIEVLYYPSKLSLYPGDIFRFNVTLRNYASTTYMVFLNFSLDNATYQSNYVTFSNATYSVPNGISNLTAWLMISNEAPSISSSLTVSVFREPTTTRVQEESLFLTKQHIWYNASGSWSQAALIIINTGGRDVILDKITVRGQESPWSNVYYWRTNNVTISDDLAATNMEISGTTFDIVVQGETRTFNQASDDLTLNSGWTMIIYIMNPDSITLNDVGVTVGITIFTANAQYYKETNVEAVDGMTTEQLIITNILWASPENSSIPWALVMAKNTGSTGLSIAEVRIDYEIATTNLTFPYYLSPSMSVSINITRTFNCGCVYEFCIITSKGNRFSYYTITPTS